jgi:hypothetical protein
MLPHIKRKERLSPAHAVYLLCVPQFCNNTRRIYVIHITSGRLVMHYLVLQISTCFDLYKIVIRLVYTKVNNKFCQWQNWLFILVCAVCLIKYCINSCLFSPKNFACLIRTQCVFWEVITGRRVLKAVTTGTGLRLVRLFVPMELLGFL